MNRTSPTIDDRQLLDSAHTLVTYRRQRARARDRVRAILDAMAEEARQSLGAAFTENDPLTERAVALVVRSDERLPDDYDAHTPRPLTDTVNRLIVEVLGRALTVEITDAGVVRAFGDTPAVPLANVTDVRVSDTPDRATFLVAGSADDRSVRTEIPFVRALANLIDAAVNDQVSFGSPDAPNGAPETRGRTAAEATGNSDRAAAAS